MNQADTIKALTEGSYGTLATVVDNGYPYTTPLNYAYQNGEIYFHSALNGQKLDNITHHNKVCFSVVGHEKLLPEKFNTEYDSVIAFGKAYVVTEEEEKKKALMLLVEKYSREYTEQGTEYIAKAINTVAVYKIQIEHMTGKHGR